ncbi:MAG: cytochrome c biogenesis protein CcsA [Flavobacteriales bacterium]|nr:cytochrome c biogenesis protein CcsA [Flavobacteriales bacterium]
MIAPTDLVKRFVGPLFSTRAAGVYILLFAAAIAVGTFVENDFGTSSAQHVIYKSTWFSVLLALFCITIAVNVVRFKMVRQRRWGLLLFHLSMILILIGAAITRYFGFEGIMHIREGGSSNVILSAETFLQFEVRKGERSYRFDEPVLFSTLGDNDWKGSYLIGSDLIEVSMKEFIPNPKEVMEESPMGKPTIKVVFAGMSGREEYFVSAGDVRRIRNVLFNFQEPAREGAVNIAYREGSLLIKYDRPLVQTVMATQTTDTLQPQEAYHALMLRAMYNDGMNGFVFGDFNTQGVVHLASEGPKVKNESMTALRMDVTVNGETQELLVFGQKGSQGRPAIRHGDKLDVAVSYGAKEIALPFSLKLHDFIMDRYPGTDSPTSYASEVQLIDERGSIAENHRIFMNNVLDHDGYRFFQSSYDRDELGTYLSVNHDFWGTWVTYVGYILLTLGMVLSLFSKKSRFQRLAESIRDLRRTNAVALVLVSLICAPATLVAQKVIDLANSTHVVDPGHAELFSRLVVQDHNGRMKPMHTLSREVMRKVYRKESINGLNADQVMLGIFVNSSEWVDVPMVKLGEHPETHRLLGVAGPLAAYADFFDENGAYILRDEMRRVNALKPIDRGVFEKDLLKVDERVNIIHMMLGGGLLRIIPVPGDANNTWAAVNAEEGGHVHASDPVAERFFAAYVPALREAMTTNNYSLPNKLLKELSAYQKDAGAAVMPSEAKVKAEIFLNELNVFNRLALFYTLLGFTFLFFLFFSVFKPAIDLRKIQKVMLILLLSGFVLHTLGLGLRWFVSGRAPWSNGYESMIYIAWTTVLAGLLFSRRSLGGSAATMILSAAVLLVAMLSYLDPEITPLVPVLRSYWLTIHVSLEAGSYGFLMLGAVIGLMNLILMTILTKENERRIHRIVKEMSYLSEMTLIGGLFMISIGTYLGGVWANESWGRYWGWDAKETWALVTILVYAFILHMRIIPKMQGLFAYNVSSLFGLATVIMTYYGVNYYLSGLHSYAAGDPVPVPQWVYIGVATLVGISILAFIRKRRFALFK